MSSRPPANTIAILNDVLDVSKIEAGKLALEHVEFDLGKLCAGAISTFAAVADSKSLRLELAITELRAAAMSATPRACGKS